MTGARGEFGFRERMASWMSAFAICGVFVCALSWHWNVALAFSLGAALGILNYLWLHDAADVVISAQEAKVSIRPLVKFCFRYPMVFLIVYFCSSKDWLPLGGMLAGLLVQVAGLLTEAGFQVYQASDSGQDSR